LTYAHSFSAPKLRSRKLTSSSSGGEGLLDVAADVTPEEAFQPPFFLYPSLEFSCSSIVASLIDSKLLFTGAPLASS